MTKPRSKVRASRVLCITAHVDRAESLDANARLHPDRGLARPMHSAYARDITFRRAAMIKQSAVSNRIVVGVDLAVSSSASISPKLEITRCARHCAWLDTCRTASCT
jgi:hypothetical protein